jgi:DNA polymerase III subunit beta
MKVICNRGALLDGILVASTVVTSRVNKLALQCVKLTAKDNTLTLSATDTEVFIRYTDTAVQIEVEGEALVPADKLRDIVRESVDDTLSIEITGETALVKGQDSTFKVFTQKPSDFPEVAGFVGDAHFMIPGGQLKQLISRTLFAASKESSRYAFNGVLLVAKGKKISFVATDGRRLSKANADLLSECSIGGKDGVRAIIPPKTLLLTEKLIADPEEAVSFQVYENRVVIHTSRCTLTSNLVEGTFPPFEDVIPKDADKKMSASTADLLSAIRRASLLTSEESKAVRLAFAKKGLTLSSRSPDSGEAEVRFACKFEGGEVEIGFNAVFLTEALRVVDTDEVTMELSASNRPGLLRGGEDYLYVIMPVSLT